jgi:hypothetical protein
MNTDDAPENYPLMDRSIQIEEIQPLTLTETILDTFCIITYENRARCCTNDCTCSDKICRISCNNHCCQLICP